MMAFLRFNVSLSIKLIATGFMLKSFMLTLPSIFSGFSLISPFRSILCARLEFESNVWLPALFFFVFSELSS